MNFRSLIPLKAEVKVPQHGPKEPLSQRNNYGTARQRHNISILPFWNTLLSFHIDPALRHWPSETKHTSAFLKHWIWPTKGDKHRKWQGIPPHLRSCLANTSSVWQPAGWFNKHAWRIFEDPCTDIRFAARISFKYDRCVLRATQQHYLNASRYEMLTREDSSALRAFRCRRPVLLISITISVLATAITIIL